jgi:hypothetical protein
VKAQEMVDLLDRHMHAELDADLEGLMATLAPNPIWGPPVGDHIEGREAIREHYAATLVKGRFEARRLRSWCDEDRQEAVSEYVVGVNLDDGKKVEFPVIAIVAFEGDLMKSECLYYDQFQRPVDLLPPEIMQMTDA